MGIWEHAPDLCFLPTPPRTHQMTYLTFHLVFILPPIALLSVTQPRPLAGMSGWRPWAALPLVSLLALAYTTLWDNYLVYRGVWWYGAERVLFTIGYVPAEEYAFFVLQPILTGLVLYPFVARMPVRRVPQAGRVRVAGTFVYAVLAVAGAVLLVSGWARGLYLGLILAWAGPVLAVLWAYGGHAVWRRRRPAAAAVALSTAYLWIADRTAIALGIWDISDAYSLGWDPLGLPVEEATFFLLTNLLVVQGLILFIDGEWVGRPEQPLPDAPQGVSAERG